MSSPTQFLAPELADILIVGGGPAGITSALSVARNVHTAVDGKNPIAFRDAARQNTLDNYESVFFQDVEIKQAKKNNDGVFELTDENGKVWKGKALVLATGIIDIPVDIPGFDECWGRSIFHCLFCHGYEQRGSASSGVLAIGDVAPVPLALHVSRNAAQLTKSVTIYTNGDASRAAEIQAGIGSVAPFTVDSRRITKFVLGPNQIGLTMCFEDGSSKEEAFLSHKPKSKIKSSFLAEQLGLELTPQGDLKVNPPFGDTNLSGCFAAGDNSSFLKTSPNAVNSGANSAAGTASHVQSRLYGQESLGEFMQKMQK
ncbi:Thioredoxin reductase [Lachnellula hyalina]|uniref:Thioredoxin reductase n=1 Tax=Lachnellula hyalina TaxID=1316788 RepID=A0A8H8R2N7_9HELO|nr:Thioredoxin reductase [Lachnellula hyalina]TVY27407.1 Thioredoxin reductase [Lachnellula hyalina]